MFHVSARSVAEEPIFRDAGDYATGIRILASLVDEELLICHAFCLMPTHYHVLGSFVEDGLRRAAHKLNRRYATRFNHRYARRGHVFDSPYSSVEVSSDEQLWEVTRYIARNPPTIERWPASSYPGLIGLREPFSFVDAEPLLDAFGSLAALRAFVEAERPHE
jgi:putative transposase